MTILKSSDFIISPNLARTIIFLLGTTTYTLNSSYVVGRLFRQCNTGWGYSGFLFHQSCKVVFILQLTTNAASNGNRLPYNLVVASSNLAKV